MAGVRVGEMVSEKWGTTLGEYYDIEEILPLKDPILI